MEHSSSKPPNFNADPVGDLPRKVSPNGADGAIDNDLNEQIIADRLLAALSGGNLVHLEEARKAFVKPEPTDQELADLAAQLERRSAPRDTGRPVVSDDQLRKEEEALNRAERELERRRAEVQAGKRKAEAETKRRAADEARRQLEEETQRRTLEEEQRLAELEGIRQRARAAVHERERKAEELNAEIAALRKYEEEHLIHIAEAEARIRIQDEACHRAEDAAKERREKQRWLSAELETLRETEAAELKRIEEIEARILKQMEAARADRSRTSFSAGSSSICLG